MFERIRASFRAFTIQRIIGLLMALFFTVLILLVTGIVPSDIDLGDTPAWVIVAAYGIFLSVSLLLILERTRWEAASGLIAVGAILIGLALILNWGAFGPGSRECTITISLPFIGGSAASTESQCRAVIGYVALLLDAVLLTVAANRILVTFGDHWWTRALLYLGYALIGLCLLPILLIVGVIALAVGAKDKVMLLFERLLRPNHSPPG